MIDFKLFGEIETRPLSKLKRWRLAEIVEKARKAYEPLITSPEERALYNAFNASWGEYLAGVKQVLVLSRKNQDNEARALNAASSKRWERHPALEPVEPGWIHRRWLTSVTLMQFIISVRVVGPQFESEQLRFAEVVQCDDRDMLKRPFAGGK